MRFRTLGLSAVVALIVAGLSIGAGGAAGTTRTVTAKTKTCKPPKYPSAGYFTSLTVKGVTCAKGNQLIVAYYKCRTKSGLGGKCTAKKVLGFTCKESSRQAIPTEIDARVTCTYKTEKVVHTFEQDL